MAARRHEQAADSAAGRAHLFVGLDVELSERTA